MVRLQTAPTGPGEDIELPIYFLKLHQTEPTGPWSETFIFSKIDTYGSECYVRKPVPLKKSIRCQKLYTPKLFQASTDSPSSTAGGVWNPICYRCVINCKFYYK